MRLLAIILHEPSLNMVFVKVRERQVFCRHGDKRFNIHYFIHLINCQFAVDLFHGVTGVLHGKESFLVDVCRLDGIDLIFEHRYLSGGLLEGVFMGFLAFESGSCSCKR